MLFKPFPQAGLACLCPRHVDLPCDGLDVAVWGVVLPHSSLVFSSTLPGELLGGRRGSRAVHACHLQ